MELPMSVLGRAGPRRAFQKGHRGRPGKKVNYRLTCSRRRNLTDEILVSTLSSQFTIQLRTANEEQGRRQQKQQQQIEILKAERTVEAVKEGNCEHDGKVKPCGGVWDRELEKYRSTEEHEVT
jgi:hypothetical protein